MKRYVVKFSDESFLGKRAIGVEDHTERYGYISNLNDACIFKSLKEAKSAWAKNKKMYKETYHIDIKKVSFEEVPSKGLDLEDEEKELFGGVCSPFDKDYTTWERYAVKELTATEALHKLSDFVPDHENYKDHLTLYFWDTYDDNNGYGFPHGGFSDGGFKPLYGYNHENSKFISENLVGAWQYKDHAGSYRVIDSGYRIPMNIDGKLRWCNIGFLSGWIRHEGHKIEEVKPAFETSIDLEKFMKELEKSIDY